MNERMVLGALLRDWGPGRASHRMWCPPEAEPAPWECGFNVLLDQSLSCQRLWGSRPALLMKIHPGAIHSSDRSVGSAVLKGS